MMLLRTVDQAFALYQRTHDPRALARVFDKTAPELLELARHLGSGEAAAEDLVQATFVTAIEANQTHRASEPVLPWLIGILANHARAARRKSRRALDAARAQRDDNVDPARDAEQQELQGQVAESIAALPEIYRPVLRLYLEQGLQPAEIARALERPQGTVRAQVHRGLELLRATLPAALGRGVAFAVQPARGLAAVREVVLARCVDQVGGAVSLTAAMSLGALTMVKVKVGVGVAATALAAFSLWWWLDRSEVPNSAGAVALAPADLQAGDASNSKGEPPKEDVTRREVNGPAPAAAPTRTSLRVTVHGGSAQAPWRPEGVAVRWQALSTLQDPQAGSEPVITDREGVAQFFDVAPGDTWVRVDRAEVRQFVAIEAGKAHEVAVRIPAGITVTGTVRDAADQPVAGARVLAHALALEPDLVATTDARGEFRVRDLAANVALQARARGYAPSLGMRVQGQAGSAVQLDLRLGPRARRVAGQVRDADGRAVPGARVAITRGELPAPGQPFSYALFARADDNGRFVVDEVSPAAVIVVGVPPRDSAAAPGVAQVGAGVADTSADVRLRRGAVVHGVVHGKTRARDNLSVQAWAEQPLDAVGYLANLLGMRQTAVGADGAYRITALMPGKYQLRVMTQQIVASHAQQIDEGGQYEWSPSLGQGTGLSLRIRPAAPPKGLAIPMWMVRLYRRASDGNLEFLNFAAAGSDGLARFATADAGCDYDVVVAVSLGRGPFNDLIVAHRSNLRAQAAPHELALDTATLPSAHVRGRLVDGNGTPRGNMTILARGQASEILVSHANTTTAADGRFDLGPLPPGAWDLLLGTEPTAPLLGRHQLTADQSLDLGDVIR